MKNNKKNLKKRDMVKMNKISFEERVKYGIFHYHIRIGKYAICLIIFTRSYWLKVFQIFKKCETF